MRRRGGGAVAGRLLLLALVGVVPARGETSPAVRFKDITPRSGVTFQHVIGASGERYMQESMGAGVGLLDFDADGDLDLYLVNGAPLPGYTAEGPAPANVLYRNDGHGRFTAVPAAGGAGDTGYGMGVAVGDYDNDGDPDLYVLNHGPNVLYRNNDHGTFTDVTAAAGVGDPLWSSSAAFFDADGDGDLDLYVVNYCDATVENHKWCGRGLQLSAGQPAEDTGKKWRAYCTPKVYEAQPDTFYRNEGQGHFVVASEESGLMDRNGKGLGVVPVDYDNDGDVDLHVANDSTPNQLWRNDGSGHFKEVGLLAGIAYSEDGASEAGMGTDAGDYDGDGRLDLVVTNLDYETNSVLRNLGTVFVHSGYPSGVAAKSLGLVGFGTNWLDVDNDGDLDLLVANGHIIDNIRLYNDSLSYAQPNQLFVNQGNGMFQEEGQAAGLGEPNVGRGSAVGDLDGDGRVDLIITRNHGSPGIFLNRSRAGHWLGVRSRGTRSNRDGFGARIAISAGGREQVREVHAACSYQSSSDPTVHFGLGEATKVTRLSVRWPSGLQETFQVPGVDRVLTVREGEGTPRPAKNALHRGGPAKGGAPTGSGGWDRSVVLWAAPLEGKR
ncbi:MAG: CRTAC1 family protein [Acidobacteriota bacterium]